MGNKKYRTVPMKIITCAIPRDYYEFIKSLVIHGLTPSISEFARQSLSDKLSRDVNLIRAVLDKQVELPEYKSNHVSNDIAFDNRTFTTKSNQPKDIYYLKNGDEINV